MDLLNEIRRLICKYDWEKLTDAYGYCYWVPQALERLASHHAEVRELARYQLYESLYHQQSHYEATGQLCVTLIRIASLNDVPDRFELICLAAEMMDVKNNHVGKPLQWDLDPMLWSLHWPQMYEDSLRQLGAAIPDLEGLISEPNLSLRYVAAKILKHLYSHRPRVPSDHEPPKPVQTQLATVNKILDGPQFKIATLYNPDEESEQTEASRSDSNDEWSFRAKIDRISLEDYLDNPEAQNAIEILGADFPSRLTELTFQENQYLCEKLSWNSTWQEEQKVVDAVLKCVDQSITSRDGLPLRPLLVELLQHLVVAQDSAAELLAKIAVDDTDPTTQNLAARSLVKLSWGSVRQAELLDAIVRRGSFPARYGVLDAVGEATHRIRGAMDPWTSKALEVLRDSVENACRSSDPRTRQAAIVTLQELVNDPEFFSTQKLIEMSNDPLSWVRAFAASHLDLKKSEHEQILAELLTDSDFRVRERAAKVLKLEALASPVYLAMYIRALNDESPHVVKAAADVIGFGRDRNDGEFDRKDLAQLILSSQTKDTKIENFVLQCLLVLYLDRNQRHALPSVVEARQHEVPYWLAGVVRKHLTG